MCDTDESLIYRTKDFILLTSELQIQLVPRTITSIHMNEYFCLFKHRTLRQFMYSGTSLA